MRLLSCLLAVLLFVSACATTPRTVPYDPYRVKTPVEQFLDTTGRILAFTAAIAVLVALNYAHIKAHGTEVYYENR